MPQSSSTSFRPDLHTALEPGSEILQYPKLSKSCSKSELFQTGQEPQHNLHNVRLLNSPYIHCTGLSTARDCILQQLIAVKNPKHPKWNTMQIIGQNNYLKLLAFNETLYLTSRDIDLSTLEMT